MINVSKDKVCEFCSEELEQTPVPIGICEEVS